MTQITKRYSTNQISKLDEENRKLVGMYSSARIKIGLELAKRLKEFEDNNLFLRLDSDAYPNFIEYLKSLDINYKTAREIIGVYECYVLAAGLSIDELADISYHKLTAIKPLLFTKEQGEYKLSKPKSDLKKWISDAKSDMTHEDLAMKRREAEVGEHKHDFITIQICKICKLRERIK